MLQLLVVQDAALVRITYLDSSALIDTDEVQQVVLLIWWNILIDMLSLRLLCMENLMSKLPKILGIFSEIVELLYS